MGLLDFLKSVLPKAAPVALAPLSAPILASNLPSDHIHEDLSTSHAAIHAPAFISAHNDFHSSVADDKRAALEAWWDAHAGNPSAPVDLNAPEVQAILSMDKEDMQAFGGPYLEAWKHAMFWEAGRRIDLTDPEIILGLVNTHAQQVKNGYTDGVSGDSKFDTGGETKDGWAGKAHPGDNIKKMRVSKILRGYKAGYWDAVKGDQLAPRVAAICFDVGCGSGPHKAITMLQEACGVVADGALGPATLNSANSMDPAVLTEKIHQLRCQFYREIGVGGNARFEGGWQNRANDILML